MAYIYLRTKEKPYEYQATGNVKVTINASKKKLDDCENFEIVTYCIKYPGEYENKRIKYFWSPPSYYNLYIYTGYDHNNTGAYPYAFYWPSTNDDIVRQVDCYYSLLNPYTPVSIVFTTRAKKNNRIYYSYQDLLDIGYNYYNLKGTKFVEDKIKKKSLSDNLNDEWKKVCRGVTFHTILGKSSDIKRIPAERAPQFYVGSSKEFYKINFMSSRGDKTAKLYSDTWSPKTKENVYIAEIPPDFDSEYDGIIGYYCNKEPLLIECLKGCSAKTRYVRKDKDGFYWEKGNINYEDEKLAEELKKIKKESEEKITFLLDKSVIYGNSIQLIHEKKELYDHMYNYNIYKHTPTAQKSSFILYGNFSFVIKNGPDVKNKKYKHIEVYSLNLSKELHLLVKFTENGTSGTGFNENYYFRNNKEGKEWKRVDTDPVTYGKNLVDRIYELYYNLKKSIKIQLEHCTEKEYPVKIVENSTNGSQSESSVADFNITVEERKACIDGDNYKCYVHRIPKLDGNPISSDIAGIRLYDKTNEIKIFNDDKASENDRKYLHYLPATNKPSKLYAYFDGTSNNLLLVCYGMKAYKRKSKEDTVSFVLYNDLRSCDCSLGNKKILKSKLDEIKENSAKESKPESSGQSPSSSYVSPSADIPSDQPSGTGESDPAGTEDVPREGFWEKYRIYILAAIGVVGLICITVIGVLLYRKCSRKGGAKALKVVV